MISVERLSISELLDIAEQAKVLGVMADRKTNRVVVDYVPARSAITIPREDADDEGLEVFPSSATPITFVLEDAFFGGTLYVALTSAGRVLVHPFVFQSFEELGKQASAGYLKRNGG